MAAKLTSSHSASRLNILQPKRFNTNHGHSVVTSIVNNNCSPLHNDPLGTSPGGHSVAKESPIYISTPGATIFPLSLGVSATVSSGITTMTTTRNRPPNTMAKRNARERNRVKQVNQGFQTLRQHIPDNYRVKKMSKVDTLRCALNYIRSLEKVLDFSPSTLKMDNSDFEIVDDFSPDSLSPGMMDGMYTGSGESCSDQSFVYGVNESTGLEQHCHQQDYNVLELVATEQSNLLSHGVIENSSNCGTDENFKREIEDHFLTAEIQ